MTSLSIDSAAAVSKLSIAPGQRPRNTKNLDEYDSQSTDQKSPLLLLRKSLSLPKKMKILPFDTR